MNHPAGEADHIVFRVPDMAAAMGVWRDLLGFEPIKAGAKWSEFSAGGVRVALLLDEGAENEAGGGAELVIRVPSIVSILSKIQAAGVSLIQPAREICSEEGHGYLYARVAVPGGVLGLYERRSAN